MKNALLVAVFAVCPGLVAQPPTIYWTPPSLSLTGDAGSSTYVQGTSRLQNSSIFAWNFVANSNQGWMSVSPGAGVIAANSFLEFTISVNPKDLQTGTYSGKITITLSGSQDTAVLDVVVQITGLAIAASPTSLEFQLPPEGSETRPVAISMSDSSTREYTATPVFLGGGNWLSITSALPLIAPNNLLVRATATGMELGTVLLGEIRLAVPSAPNVTRVIPVKLTVSAEAPGLTVVPTQMNFYSSGTLQPPVQPLFIYTSVNSPAPFDIIKPAGSDYLSFWTSRGITPGVVPTQVDTMRIGEMPRLEMVTVQAQPVAPFYLPVKTDIEPQRVYAIPQIADGGGFKTMVTVVNTDKVAATVSLRFYKSDPITHATTVWNPTLEGNSPTEGVIIPVGGAWTVQTTGASTAISQGWAEVVCREQVSGLAVFQLAQGAERLQEAAVPINSTMMQRHFLPFDNTSGYVTSMAIVNLSTSETAKVMVAFRDNTGRHLKTEKLPDMPPRGHQAFELTRLYPYLNEVKGVADFWILSGRMSSLGLRFNPTGAFTSFEGQTLNRRPAGRRSIPQVADGGAYRTTIVLVNNDVVPAQVQLAFRRNSGDGTTVPWGLAFQNNVSPDSITIPVGTSFTLETAGLSPSLYTGWGEVITSQSVTGFAVFRQIVPGRPDQEAAVPINHGTPGKLVMPFDNTARFTTTLALANMSSSTSAQVTFTFRDPQGQKIHQSLPTTVTPGGHSAFRLIDQFPTLDGKRGTMEIQTPDGELTALGLRFTSSGAYTSFKATPVQ